MARRAEPVRTCVGCRSRAARSDLLRIVVVGDELVPDVRHQKPGRGANVHPDLVCLDVAERRRAFPRALRVPGPLRLDRVRAHVVSRQSVGRQGVGKQGSTTPTDVDTEAGRDSDDRSMSTKR